MTPTAEALDAAVWSSTRQGVRADLVNALVADAPLLSSEQILALRLLIHG